MRRTKASRVVTFVMAASLLIGSIHVVGAKEQSKEYDAPELTLLQGASDYDLTEGITYDSEKYTLSVTDTGNFDISVPGDYEVSYALTENEKPVENTESTEGTETIESTEMVEDTETVENTETVESTETVPTTEETEPGKNPEDAGEENKPDTADTSDSTDDTTSAGENGTDASSQNSEDKTETDTQTDAANSALSDVTIEDAETPKADASNIEGTGSKQKTINFKRTVHVVAAEDEISTFSDEDGIAVQAANSDNIKLGNAVWTDDTQEYFSFPAIKYNNNNNNNTLVSITVTSGTLRNNNNYSDIKMYTSKGNDSLVFWTDNSISNNTVQKIIKETEFSKNVKKISVIVDANDTKIPDTIDRNNLNLLYVNAVYYDVDNYKPEIPESLYLYRNAFIMYVDEKTTWLEAAKKAREFEIAGLKGQLYAVTGDIEVGRITYQLYNVVPFGKKAWTGATNLKNNSGQYITADANSTDTYTPDQNLDSSYKIVDGVWKGKSIQTAMWSVDTYMNWPSNTNNAVGVYECKTPLYDSSKNSEPKPLNEAVDGYLVLFIEEMDQGNKWNTDWDRTKQDSINYDVTKIYSSEVKITDSTGANEIKYAPLADALNVAVSGDKITMLNDTVTAVTGGTLKENVQFRTKDNKNTFSGTIDSTIDVDTDGTVTLTDGHITASDNATLKVKSPVDSNTYTITTPAGGTDVVVNNGQGGDKTPYVMNHSQAASLNLKVDDVTYTYHNESFDNSTMVYIPDAMYQNELVTKAELPADKTATIKLDDGDRNTITVKGGGAASDTVTVERRKRDTSKADVKLPANVTANVFGHEIGTVPQGEVTVSHAYEANVNYPNRDYVTINDPQDSLTVDGVTYTSSTAKENFYLGTFNVNIITGDGGSIDGNKPADPHYLEDYSVTLRPATNYEWDKNAITVTMKENDRADADDIIYSVARGNLDTVCTDNGDGSLTIKLTKVKGDITINAAPKHQTTTLKVTGLTDNGAKGTYTAEDQNGNTYKPNDDGEITVNRNEELTITFIPDDFKNPYYSDLTGEQGESFSILTGLTETSNGDNDLFDQTMKDSFDWTGKNYKLTYTPTQENVEFAASFTPSHIVHIHVTGGTAEVTDNTLLKKETAAGAQQFQHVIVADNDTVEVTLNDTTGHTPVVKTAYWSDVTQTPDDAGTNVTNSLTGAGPAYTYTTPAVTRPQALNVTFEEGQTVDVTVTHGTLDQTGRTWTDKGNNTCQTIVKNNGTLEVKVKPDTGYGLKSITVNGTPIDIEQAVKDSLLVYDADKGIYTHTSQNIYQAWKVEVDFEKQHEIIFKDQNNDTINKTEHITVVDGGTIPKATFTKMQKETDKLKADNETFFVWVDKNDNDKVYNEHTVIDVNTADQVTLTPVYRTNVTPPAADGSTIAADDFIIHVDDLKNLTEEQAKTYANVKAYDKDSNDITAQVTVDTAKLDDLKKKGKGTYTAALTFTVTGGAAVSVNVEVTDDNPTITGKTAHTLTFIGRPNTTYNVQKMNGSTPEGNVLTFKTDADGKATATGLDKATTYKISHKSYGSATGKTSLVDALDIARQFEDEGANDSTSNNQTDKTEKATNSNVDVVVDDDGNYKVIVKKDIDHTIEIPDTWEDVKIDLGGNTITGNNATDADSARPGLDFIRDAGAAEHPGTNITIINGTIKGGDGSAEHPDGAPGVGTGEGAKEPENAQITVGTDGEIIGGNGADTAKNDPATDDGANGGNGGSGIEGNIKPTVDGGTVSGGDGGKGSDSATGKPGDGGNGGAGIKADKDVTVIEGTVNGGNAGNGGDATDDNTNPGGNGGEGGSGIDGGNNNIVIGPGNAEVNGGDGGNGGNSTDGNGGNGGNGGAGTETTKPGKTENNGGTINGGDGGNGGNTENGDGGNGGNGGTGSKGETDNNGGNINGGDGGNGGKSENGNGGNGGNGGSATDKDPDNNNNGNENGGNGGNGGSGQPGGNGGNGGDGDNGNTGGNGNKGDETGGGSTESYKPVIIGKTAHTLTFTGKADTTYRVQEIADDGSLTGAVFKFKTDADGKATAVDLKKATKYRISHTKFGSVDGKTSLVDAKDIADQFKDNGDTTESNNKTDKSEKAWNENVDVVVDDNGNYKVIVKKDIDHTIEIPDTWENVKIDLGGNTITGDNGNDTDNARPGLDFVKDPTINEHPGTNLEIINGTIKGGDGSAEHPDGAPGIGTKDAPENPANAGVEVGKDANIIGGNGADTKGTDADGNGTNGGNGGAGIDGEITPTINGGTVSGGNGGKGSDSSTGKPGAGGDGGAGITTDDKKVTVIEGTVNGGNAGNGGDATGGNKNEGGAGGNGGSGIDSGNGDIVIGPGKAEVNGGDGGNGGNSAEGNGGNGGSGGNGTETEAPGKTDNNGGTINGGDGGNGGNSENGNGGDAGNGGTGSKGETDNKGDINGGNGGDGGKTDNGNGGNGGSGGSGTDGKTDNSGSISGGDGGNGGDSDKGNGGDAGNGGTGSKGETDNKGDGKIDGGNGGDGGNSNKGDGGNGGTGGNGTDGKTDNKGDINGGNGGNGGNSDNGSGGNGGNGGNATDGKPDNSNNGGTENGGNGGNGGKGQPSGNGGTGENGNGNNGNKGDSGNNGNNGGNNSGNNNGGDNSGNNGNGSNGNGGNNSNGNGSNNTSTGITDDKAGTTDIAAADDSSAFNRNNSNRNNRKNNKSDSENGEDVTDGTETDSDGTDSTEDTADGAGTDAGTDDSADGSGDADDSIPADGSDVNGQLSFTDCTFHWYPLILILVIAGYTGIRIRKIREELDEM